MAESLKNRDFVLADCAESERHGHKAFAGVFEEEQYAAYLAINVAIRTQLFDHLTIRFPPSGGRGSPGMGLGASFSAG